ncbi:hypothetical protein PFISCL1PPCAC_16332, partial [Pristionchus fissidentatus]
SRSNMDGNLSGRDYDDEDLDYEDDWRQDRIVTQGRMMYQQSYPMVQRPSMSTIRIPAPAVGIRKLPLIIRKVPHAQLRVHPQQMQHLQQQHMPVVRHIVQPAYKAPKLEHRVVHSRGMMGGGESSSSHDVPYANEETVRTSEHDEPDEEGKYLMQEHSIKRLEDDLEVDVEAVSEGPSTSMPKMIVRPKTTMPVFHPAEHKAVIENHQLKARMANLIDSNCRFRDEVAQLREEKREYMKQIRKQEKIIEKQAIDLAEGESLVADLRRREKEKDKKYERELAVRDKRRKAITVMPSLPNRKVVFSKATKQAQSLRLRLLHKYLGELCGPVEGESRLEEKNLIVLRWRKAHAPKPSLEIGRQLLPREEEDFCRRFELDGEKKKEMKRWLGQKHIDLFGPSERALAVRKWRMTQREKKRRGEKEDEMEKGFEDVMDEVGNDTDDDELMDDVESALEEEREGEEETAAEKSPPDDDSALSTHVIDDDDDDGIPYLKEEEPAK